MRNFLRRPFLRVFLDTSTQKHAVTHSFVTTPVSVAWGQSTVTTQVAVLGRKKRKGDWLQEQMRVLPKLCEAAEAGIIEFCISDETLLEGFPESGLGTETDLLKRVPIRKIFSPVHRPDLLQSTKEYVRGVQDERYRRINRATHGHHPIDCFPRLPQSQQP